jgi:hypothetical protein
MLLTLLLGGRGPAAADDIASPTSAYPAGAAKTSSRADPSRAIEERFRRLEALIGQQAEQIRRLSEENRQLAGRIQGRPAVVRDPRVTPAQSDATSTPPLPDAIPPGTTIEDAAPPGGLAAPVPPYLGTEIRGLGDTASVYSALLESGNDAIPDAEGLGQVRRYLTGFYDKGFVLVAPDDRQATPFALKLNVTTQLRYTGFTRTVKNWTDSSGLVLPLYNRSYFALNRNWFAFSGFAFSPRLQFNATVFSTSATNQTIAMGSLSYDFNEALTLSSGYFKVPGTREWIESARYTLGADRTMANTFFRPAISPGLWASGEPLDGFFYYAGIFNDFNSLSNSASRISNNMTYSGNVWWEPLRPFGPGFTDEEYHERPAIRTGASLTYQRTLREPDLQRGLTNPENTILRLSDGTPIFQPGALARGVTLMGANVALFSYDLALKYRGFSLSGEYYGRWIYGLNARGGALPASVLNLFDTGGFAQFSFAVVPKQVEVFARTSGVFGKFGDGSEYGGGANWYVLSNRNIRLTFEAKRVNHSSASNVLYGYFAGESGMLYQLQLLTDF